MLLVLMGSVAVAHVARPRIGALRTPTATGESTWTGLLADYTKSVAYISLRTVPLLVIGIWASMWIMSRVTLSPNENSSRVLAIVVVCIFRGVVVST